MISRENFVFFFCDFMCTFHNIFSAFLLFENYFLSFQTTTLEFNNFLTESHKTFYFCFKKQKLARNKIIAVPSTNGFRII